MKFAFQANQLPEMKEEGKETVLFRAQMMIDVYYHEQDPMPSLEDFIYNPLRRPEGTEGFWVYRQGTFIDAHVFRHGLLYVGEALTAELDASPEPTFEGYHHVPTLFLEAGGKFNFAETERYTLRQQREIMEGLYNIAKNGGYESI